MLFRKQFFQGIFILIALSASAQKFADKQYYLVDSLALTKVSEYELELLNSSLDKFHASSHDTSKLQSLEGLIQQSNDDNIWPKYNKWVHIFTKNALKNDNLNPRVKRIYTEYLAGSYNDFGYHFSNVGNMIGALDNYHKALKIQIKINDLEGMATSFNNIGFIYDEQGNENRGLEYYKKGYQIQRQIGDDNGMSYTLSNIGLILYRQGKLDSANLYLNEALAVRLKIDDKSGIGHSYNIFGDLYSDKEEYDKALEYYKKSLAIREEINDKEGLSSTLSSLSAFYLNRSNLKKAQIYAERGLKIAQSIGYPSSIKLSAEQLSDIHLKRENYQKALEMYKLAIQMSDSLDNKDVQKIMVQEQDKIEHEKQMAIEKAHHEKRLAIENERQEKQRFIIYATGIGIILLIAFLIFVYKRLQISNRQRRQIEEQREALAEVNEELNQTNEEISAQRDQIEEQKNVVEEQHEDIISSINYAQRIQAALLKSEEHETEHLPPHFILFKPKDIVSGDFYWALEKQGHLYLAAVDCTGHGVPGGFLTMLGSSFLSEINSTPLLHSPATILDLLRNKIVKELSQSDGKSKDGMDISLIRINLSTFASEWAGANNPLYIIREGSNEMEIIQGDRQPISIFSTNQNFTNHSFKLSSGDQFYIFSDGYSDQFGGEHNKKIGSKKFRELLLENSTQDMDKQKIQLDDFFKKWTAYEEQIDDVCVIGMKI